MDTQLMEFVLDLVRYEYQGQRATLLYLQHQQSLPLQFRIVDPEEPIEPRIKMLVPNIEKLEKAIKLIESWITAASGKN